MSSNGATKISERVETVSVEVAVEDPVSDVVNDICNIVAKQ